MKKQILVALLGIGVLTTGCQQEVVDVPAELQSVEGSLPIVYKGLILELEPYVEGQQVTVKANIKNNGVQEMALRYENKDLLDLEIKAPAGEIQTSVVSSDVLSLKPGQQIALEAEFNLSSTEGEHVIKAHLNLLDTKEFVYVPKELDALEVLQFDQQQNLSFLPTDKTTYIYENKVGNEVNRTKEEFMYFKDGFVQSNSTEMGTRIYYMDQKGLYITYAKPESRNTKLIGKVEYNKQQILSFPIAVGSTWQTEGIQYEVISIDEKLQLANKAYTNVVVIGGDFGTGVRYYYHEKVGLLQVSVKNGEEWEATSKLVDIQ